MRDDWNSLRRLPLSHKTIRCDGKDDVYAGCELSSVFAKQLTVASSGSYNQNSFFAAEFAEQPFANQSFSVRAQRTRKEASTTIGGRRRRNLAFIVFRGGTAPSSPGPPRTSSC